MGRTKMYAEVVQIEIPPVDVPAFKRYCKDNNLSFADAVRTLIDKELSPGAVILYQPVDRELENADNT